MYLLKVIVFLSLLSVALSEKDYQNVPEGDLSFECKRGYGLYRVESVHGESGAFDDRRKRTVRQSDRQWLWQCRKIDIWHKDFCDWYEGINNLGEAMFFQCPLDAFMAGVSSVYDTSTEDRTWNVKCCRILNVCMQHCTLTDVLADYHDPIDYAADDDCGVFAGFFSDFIDSASDREFRLEECQFGSCGHPKKYVYKK